MAVLWLGNGTASVSRTETALATGTATPGYVPDVYVYGTATVDRETLVAWGAQTRRTATRVFLGETGEDLARVQGDVSIDLDSGSPVATASFSLTDERCAYHDADSIATGGIPVSVRCRVSIPGATADTTVFRGLTEAAQSGGAYVPTAQIQCAGEGEEWLTEKGCLSLAAFAGYTRLAILQAFAESVGIDADRITGGENSRTPRLQMDLSGLSTWELAQRFARLEDWYVRGVAGDLEILPARRVVGDAAESIYDFTQSNLFSTSETPPNRPTTRLVLSTIGVPEEILTNVTEETTPQIQGGTYADGTDWETRTLTTTVNDVVIRQRIEEWRDAAIPGVTPSAVAWRLWKLTETESTWGTVTVSGVSLRTARLNSQTTTVTEWYSAPCRTASGSVWSDGSRHIASAATWQVTSESVTTYTYDADCLLTSKVTDTGGWYSEIVASGQTYDDGSVRQDNSYQWTAADAAQPYSRVEETYAEESSAASHSVSVTSVTSRWYTPPGLAVEAWGEAEGASTLWTTVPGSGVIGEATSSFAADGSSEYSSRSYVGELPVLTRASAAIPQYRTVPLVLEATADTGSPAVAPVTETAWGAETIDPDLTTYARRRFRDEHSPRVTVLHPAIPLLKLYDVVTLTDPKLGLSLEKAYVEKIRLNLNASNTGRLAQETVLVFPLAAFDPPAEVVN